MNDFKYEVDEGEVTITRYKGNGGDVAVPDTIDGRPVTIIGAYAFRECFKLTSITLPNSLTTIGCAAFGSCTGLTIIILPNSITTIGNDAFYGCTGLTSINIPEGCSIGDDAFEDCPATITIRDKENE